MSLKIYLLRHGETDYNLENSDEFGQGSETSLNDLGVKQAERLGEVLKGIKIDKFYSSDLKRAIQTAEILSSILDIPLIKDKRLREFYSGKIKPSSEKWINKYKQMLNSGMSKYDIRPFGGENIWDFIKRINSFMEDLKNEEGTIAIMAHGGVNSTFINLTQLRQKDDFIGIKQDNGCINILEFSGGKWKIKVVNDSGHITDIKPKKKNYENQNEIKESSKNYVLEKLNEVSEEIYLVGDIVSSEFGLYDRPYKRYSGSTVETYVILKKDLEIPKEWKISIITKDLKKYEIGKIKINGIEHKVNVTLIGNMKDIQEKNKEKIL